MPRVNIRELDLTGIDTGSFIDNIVLVPGVKIELIDPETAEYLKDDNGKDLTLDGTYETIEQFENQIKNIFSHIPDPSESGEDPYEHIKDLAEHFIEDKGYAIAYLILNGGLPVEYGGLYDVDILEDGIKPIYPTDDKGAAITAFYNKYADRGAYDVKFITIPDIDEIESETVIKTLITQAIFTAGNRGDAYALINATSAQKTSDDVLNFVTLFNTEDVLRKKIERPGITWNKDDNTEIYGSYAAIFSPNFVTTFTVISPVLVNSKQVSYEFKKTVFPAFVNYLLCYGKYTKVTPDWYAISGSTRGVTPLATMIPLNKYGDADIDKFQKRSVDDLNEKPVAVNAICNIRPYGNIIWGNRTMHPLSAPFGVVSERLDSVQLVASDFLNIRSLCCDIKKTLYRAARRYTFDPNSDVLWINFKSAITPLLEKMKSNDGIRDYLIVKVPTTKKALLAARIIISPIEAVEDFDLTVELNDAVEVVES